MPIPYPEPRLESPCYRFPYRGYVVTVFYAAEDERGLQFAAADVMLVGTRQGWLARDKGCLTLTDAANLAIIEIDAKLPGAPPSGAFDV